MADVDGVVAAAVAQTGLDDFGDDSFREGLEILLASLRDEARLNARGEGFLYPRIVDRICRSGCRSRTGTAATPRSTTSPIVPPLIGLGLPRTGSTALSFLLAQDPAFGTCAAGSRRSRARRRRR